MCGIAGFVGAKAGPITRKMVRSLKHRGPDGSSVWDNGSVSLGHTHLKVTGDLSQPVIQDGKAIVYNGEIYNFGEFLPGTSDTEALAGVILKNGMDSFLKAAPLIDGEYAFAYYDGSRLLLARDPVGIKPLFYGECEDGFGFASEKKALMGNGIKNIKALAPGYIYYDGAQHEATGLPPREPVITDEKAAVSGLDNALDRAVKARSHRDAAVAFSGGVDCSVIGAMSGLPLCTVGMEGSFDIKAAKKAARLMGAEKRHIVYEFGEKDVEEALPEVVYAVESADPMKVSIALPIYILAKECQSDPALKYCCPARERTSYSAAMPATRKALRSGTLGEMLDHDLTHIAEVNLERDDAATMAHGVELRVPYLDLGVMAVARRTDPSLKVSFDGKDYIRKYVLRKISEKYLPARSLVCAEKGHTVRHQRPKGDTKAGGKKKL